MRLPSRWVTNPGSTLKAKSGPHSEVRSFFVPADMGRGCIGHPPAQGAGPPVPAGGTTGLRPFAGGRECFLPLAPAHAEGAPESGRRQQDTPPGREEEFTKGEKPPKKEGRGAGETMRRGGVGETVQGRRCRGDGAGERRCRGETMQGRDDAGERRCRGDDAAHREKAEPPIQGTRTTDSPKTTTYPENPAPLKKPGSTGKPRLLLEKPRPARIRKKTPAGRCRE